MKKFLLVLSFFAIQFSNAQCPTDAVTLTTQTEIDNFIVLYPDCTEISSDLSVIPGNEGPITSLSGLQNITSISGNLHLEAAGLTDLSGLENLASVGGNVEIDGCPFLTDISALSSLAAIGGELYIEDSSATELSVLTSLESVNSIYLSYTGMMAPGPYLNLELSITTLQYLFVDCGSSITSISGLNYITEVQENAVIKGPSLTSLQIFDSLETVGGDFVIGQIQSLPTIDGFNSLESVGNKLSIGWGLELTEIQGFSNLQSAGGLVLVILPVLTDISGFSSLEQINGQGLEIIYCSQLPGLDGLDGLTSLNYSGINIKNNPLLNDISALENINSLSITFLTIKGNEALEVCSYPNLCNYVQWEDAVYTIETNHTGCNSFGELVGACENTINILSGIATSDFEGGECSNPEFYVHGARIQAIDTAGVSYTTYSEPDGSFTLYLPDGEYTVTAMAGQYNTASVTVVCGGEDGGQTVNFCFSSEESVSDIKVTVYPVNEARPGFDAVYAIVCENQGTTTQSGAVTFQFDEDKLDVLTADPATSTAIPGELGWNYTLNPFQSQTFTVTLNILPPPVNNNDDVLVFTASVPADGDETPEDNANTLNQILVGSYDPNDKTVMEGDEVLIENAGDYLTYRIRFQNTGTASAINIRLEDELDASLDLATFEPLAASHPDYRVELIDNMLKVYFDGIELPAQEDDDAGSNGFFTFRIKPATGMEVGDIISNTADIYFDFNTPIITNTVTTEFVTPAGIRKNGLSKLAMYPNPAKSVVYFRGDTAIVSVALYNSLGQQVTALKSAEGISQMDVSSLASGLYMCHATAADGTISVQKLVISK